MGDAHRATTVPRRDLRRRRHSGAARRRLRRQQHLRLRVHGAGHGRRVASTGTAVVRATRGRSSSPTCPSARTSGSDPGPETAVRFFKEGGATRSSSRAGPGRRADRGAHRRRHPGDGPPRVHPAERAHPRRVPGAGPGCGRRQADRGRAGRAEAGAFAVVLEMVPGDVAKRVTPSCAIPTVGIGAGPDTDAQVLVWPDMAGLNTGKAPRFVKRYADLAGVLSGAADSSPTRSARASTRRRNTVLVSMERPAHLRCTRRRSLVGHPLL